MRASELLGSEVLDAAGRSLGPVRDLRVTADGLEVVGIVVGGGRFAGIAHRWGYAEGRAAGPWPLRALTASAVERARFVASERVVSWGPGTLRLNVEADALPPLREDAPG